MWTTQCLSGIYIYLSIYSLSLSLCIYSLSPSLLSLYLFSLSHISYLSHISSLSLSHISSLSLSLYSLSISLYISLFLAISLYSCSLSLFLYICSLSLSLPLALAGLAPALTSSDLPNHEPGSPNNRSGVAGIFFLRPAVISRLMTCLLSSSVSNLTDAALAKGSSH